MLTINRRFWRNTFPALLSVCTLSVSVMATESVDWPMVNTQLKPNLSVEHQIDELMATMSIEQKVAQLIQPEISYLSVEKMRKYGFGSYLNGGNSAPYGNKTADSKTWLRFADEMYLASIDSSQDQSTIPTIWGTDAMHGHSNVYGATLFPHNIGLGAANDAELIKKIGKATAKEVSVTGIEWSFAPTVAVVRDDRWGRTYESYSEDPDIVKRYASAMVSGLQGDINDDFLNGYHRIATAKHFVGDGGTENGIDRGNTVIDEKTLRDIHAAGYFSAIEAGVQSVMASFNSWNSRRVHGSKYLLTTVLKKKMGFDGFVVSDWNAHKFVKGCDLEQCAGAFNAGVDVMMVPEHYEAFYHNTVKQVKQGDIKLERINDAVRRFLRAKVRWGLFTKDKPSSRAESKNTDWLNAPEHKALAREAVRKSLVLLKNNTLKNNQNVLPISPRSKILVTGNGAHNIAKQAGGWSVSWQGTDNTNADFPNAVSIFDGLKEQVLAAGGEIELSQNAQFKQKPDIAIVVFGEEPYAEWFGDIQGLEYQQDNKKDLVLLKSLQAQNIPVVSVFISGRPLWVNKEINASDAFVAAWLPGSQGQGVADVLLLDKNDAVKYDFTGKLSFSWPKFDDQFILNKGDKNYDPLFAYGYGLSYKEPKSVKKLSEKTSPKANESDSQGTSFFVRNLAPNVRWALSDQTQTNMMTKSSSAMSADGKSISMQSVNLAYQEDGRQFVWNNTQEIAIVSLRFEQATTEFKDVDKQFIQFDIRVDDVQSDVVELRAMCGEQVCLTKISLMTQLTQLKNKGWQTVAIKLGCSAAQTKMNEVTEILSINAQHPLNLAIANVALVKATQSNSLIIGCNDL
ncbi:glycoside hydrolase family 3 protein [Pseudoalteromonas sp. BSi20495]|uniref:glycoside hydrolase family 3 protein n=1 Tax=Pseudoalteromonas sp. BSi20495 TaxID=386429 RepID=UPI0002315630|nr:glycoside hydrolase family 3 N-terminal domain-containing protein [Pseudoalteromonas sp. BSi20495]GAA78086.1 beta-glucosidase [Pseudoalteromonas sp. BSi20495]